MIAIEPLSGGLIRNQNPERNAWAWKDGIWCGTTLGSSIHVRVGWDGLINRAYDNADDEPSGHWIAES